MSKFSVAIIIILLSPIVYIKYFLITQYRLKLSFPKYLLLLTGYVFFLAVTVWILTAGLINLVIFVLIHLIVVFIAVWRERVVFVEELKSITKND